MRYLFLCCLLILVYNCKPSEEKKEETSTKVETTNEVEKNTSETSDDNDLSDISTKDFREFKVLDSKYINTDDIWNSLNTELQDFSEKEYNTLKSLVLEQDIPTLQKHMAEGKLTYEKLTQILSISH